MKNKVLFGSLFGMLITGLLVFPITSHAFWPFTNSSEKGEVKGEQTSVDNESVFQKVIRSFRSQTPRVTPTPTPTPEDIEIESLDEEKLRRAVQGKAISEAQRQQLVARLRIINAKREELRKLQEEFRAWMKTNKIDLSEYTPDKRPLITPTGKSEPIESPVVTTTPKSRIERPTTQTNN